MWRVVACCDLLHPYASLDPASRVSFDLARKIGKRIFSKKIQGDTARRVPYAPR